jgi:hypothetical protein
MVLAMVLLLVSPGENIYMDCGESHMSNPLGLQPVTLWGYNMDHQTPAEQIYLHVLHSSALCISSPQIKCEIIMQVVCTSGLQS